MIGLLTFHITNNFGAYLHTIALYKKIKEMGVECEVIDYRCPSVVQRETPRAFTKYTIKELLSYFLFNRQRIDKFKKLANEVREYITLSDCYTPENIIEANQKYDGYIIGSDVVWSLRITENDYNYFLRFADDKKKKIAFSSSVGDCELYRDDSLLPGLLRRFDSIAVRDEEAIDWVKDISGMEASYVCDPTMLYDAEQWDNIIQPKVYEEDYVLTYFIGKGKMLDDAKAYADKYNLKVKVINNGLPLRGVDNVSPRSLKEFLGLIKHSKAVFTASYHGMLFALYYNRELVYYNRGLKARMASLARLLQIETHDGDVFDCSNYTPLNYNLINQRIADFRNSSIAILKTMLK